MRTLSLQVAAIGCMMSACMVAPAQSRFTGNDVVVKYREAAVSKHATPRAFAASRGLIVRKELRLPRTTVVDGGMDAAATVARLSQDPDVEYATRDRWISLASTMPNDPLFSNQYDLHNTGQNGGTPGADIQAANAWDVTTGSAAVTIAISDTGTQMDHPDLASRIWVNPGEIPDNGIDDDTNGFIDDVRGWDFFSDSNSTAPVGSHGTSTLGIAGAAGNNGIGIAGVDWNARMMVVKGFGPSGFGLESDLVDGVVYAIDNGAKIVNQSWGDYDTSPLMDDMALYAQENGALLVPAVGNQGVDTDEYPFYPACLPYDSLISVGGSEQRDDAIYEGVNGPVLHNYGATTVQIAAASWAVPFTSFPNSYGSGHGTSYAAPLVSGAAGLVLSVFPALDGPQLKFRIMGTAAAKLGLRHRNATDGRLDVATAVSLQDSLPPEAVTDLAIETAGWNGAVLRFTAPGGNGASGQAAHYQLRVTTGPLTLANWYQLPYTPPHIRPQVRGTTERILLNELVSGANYNAAIRAVDHAGNAGPISNVVLIAVPHPATILLSDDCDSVHPAWTANGFTLAPGFANTGILSWQDSPSANYSPSASGSLTAQALNLTSLSKPRLSFYLRRYFPMASDRVDSLRVEASTNGASWKLLRRIHGCHAPMRREVVQLDEVVGPTTVIRFVFAADSGTVVSDGVYIDDIRVHDGIGGVPETRDIVAETMDFFTANALPPEYSLTGTWHADVDDKSRAPKAEGYRSFRTAAGATATGTFTPFIPFSGKYEVYTTWGSAETAFNITCRVKSIAGETSHVVDQLGPIGHRWHSLGVFEFPYGRDATNAAVTIDASTATGQSVRADAIRLRLAEYDATPSMTGAHQWHFFD